MRELVKEYQRLEFNFIQKLSESIGLDLQEEKHQELNFQIDLLRDKIENFRKGLKKIKDLENLRNGWGLKDSDKFNYTKYYNDKIETLKNQLLEKVVTI
ncbi:MAG: hypothetical protein GX879_04460 [Bacteroidales bacterium]|nr:hypothetical protein [Bacteroidales bacterium]